MTTIFNNKQQRASSFSKAGKYIACFFLFTCLFTAQAQKKCRSLHNHPQQVLHYLQEVNWTKE